MLPYLIILSFLVSVVLSSSKLAEICLGDFKSDKARDDIYVVLGITQKLLFKSQIPHNKRQHLNKKRLIKIGTRSKICDTKKHTVELSTYSFF